MSYTPAHVAKALVAFLVAVIGAASLKAGGPDLSVLTSGDWFGAVGAGLVAFGGVFGTPNETDKAPEQSPVDAVIDNIPRVIAAANSAADDLAKIRQTATDALGDLPYFGSEVQSIINRIPNYPHY